MTARPLIALAAGGSLALLLAAWGFQYLGGLSPCALCLWQRWPHMAAVALGAAALAGPARGLGGIAALGGLAALTTAGIGLYHTGVERGWWPGPSSCSGTGEGLEGLSGADLLSIDDAVAPVMCDEVVWSFAGLSMASWNAVAAVALAVLWLLAARQSGSRPAQG